MKKKILLSFVSIFVLCTSFLVPVSASDKNSIIVNDVEYNFTLIDPNAPSLMDFDETFFDYELGISPYYINSSNRETFLNYTYDLVQVPGTTSKLRICYKLPFVIPVDSDIELLFTFDTRYLQIDSASLVVLDRRTDPNSWTQATSWVSGDISNTGGYYDREHVDEEGYYLNGCGTSSLFFNSVPTRGAGNYIILDMNVSFQNKLSNGNFEFYLDPYTVVIQENELSFIKSIRNKIDELLGFFKGNDVSNEIANNNNQSSNNAGNTFDEYNDIESGYMNDMSSNLGSIDTSNNLFAMTDFLATGTFVSTQLENIYNSNVIIQNVIMYGLILGLALTVIGISTKRG